ncbi:S8 family serine peptidase [Candidatus Beckwithbacteria bacterium]|nr:S8 family serine peptidase [Candidatus Beckwithbacteria bacterium]
MSKTSLWLGLVFLAAFLMTSFYLLTPQVFAKSNQNTNQIIVKYKEDKTPKILKGVVNFLKNRRQIAEKNQKLNSLKNMYVIEASAETLEETIKDLETDENVEYAVPDRELNADIIISDPYYTDYYQWYLRNPNYLDMNKIWEQQASSSAVMAIIDTGIDLSHEDLQANLWINHNEVDNNGIDDDGNGYIDDIYGWNSYNDTNDIRDDVGHGTAVYSVAAATANNNLGIVGMAWTGKVMVIKANYPGSSTFNTSSILKAIAYASSFPEVKVINLSLGATVSNQAEQDAITDIVDQNKIVVVASVGNNSADAIHFPAGYSGVLGASAYSKTDFAYFSNYGFGVDLAAPGDDIYTAKPSNSYGFNDGTSFASPMIGALGFLYAQKHPDYSALQIVEILKNFTKPPFGQSNIAPEWWNSRWGYGRISSDGWENNCNGGENIKTEALIKSYDLEFELEDQYPLYPEGAISSLQTIAINGWATSNNLINYKLEWGEGIEPISWSDSGISLVNNGTGGISNGLLGVFDLRQIPESGVYTLRLIINGEADCLGNIVGQDRIKLVIEKQYSVSGKIKNLSGAPIRVPVVFYTDYANKIYEKFAWSNEDTGEYVNNELSSGVYIVAPHIFGEETYEPEFWSITLDSANTQWKDINFIQQTGTPPSPTPTSTPTPTPTPTPAQTCTDSDGGKDYLVKGTGSGWNTDTEFVGFYDTCYQDYWANLVSSCTGDTCYLAEKYCQDQYVKTELWVPCAYGCSDGACLPEPTPTPTPAPTCADTDGGLNYAQKGHISGTGLGCNNSGWDDFCYGDILQEAHCGSLNQCFTDAYTCPYGCSDGACLPEPTPTPTPIPNSKVVIYAQGTQVDNVYPSMALEIKGTRVKTFTNISSYKAYEYQHNAPITASDITLRFLNDTSTSTQDRNLRVDKIILDGMTYETEDYSTFSVGSWSSFNGCGQGYKQSEWLHCNGTFSFDSDANSSILQIYASGSPALGEYPIIDLNIDQVKVGSFKSLSNTLQVFAYKHPSKLLPKDIKLVFANDKYSAASNEDRNLLVDKIVLDGVTYETEAPSVYSSGAWSSTLKACATGYLKTQKLACNGYFQF